jgi:predicted nuclease of predicted toxin-antitoxin system
MKLLFDENISPRLSTAILEVFPGSVHVRSVGLSATSDEAVWNHAASNGFAIVSKDSDFHQRSLFYGFPPKVVWVRTGNCSTDQIIDLIRSHTEEIERFISDPEASFSRSDSRGHAQRAVGRPTIQKIVKAVATVFDIDRRDVQEDASGVTHVPSQP